MLSTKTRVDFFVSYAHDDKALGRKLLEELWVQMRPSAKYEFKLWDDRAILTGERWEQEIERAIAKSHLGLLLVSPAFLGSAFITGKELPRFVGDECKPAIPVEVESINRRRHDLKGLEQHQLFRLDGEKSFGQCTGGSQARFAQQLYDQIERRLDRLGF